MTEEEAQGMIRQLQQHYRSPVMPLFRFCGAIELWMECIQKLHADPAMKRHNMEQGHWYYKHLGQIRIDIRKSNLLGRLLMADEVFRTEMCPEHQGHWSGPVMVFEGCRHGCGGTGWLPVRPQDKGYTDTQVFEAKKEGDHTIIRDPESGEWKDLEDEAEQ